MMCKGPPQPLLMAKTTHQRYAQRMRLALLPLFTVGLVCMAAAGYAETNLENTMNAPHTEIATLAGGCFWGMEEMFRKLPGVTDTEVGYSGGATKDPTYERISRGDTGHAESLQVQFDPAALSYRELLRYFFRIHDPTTLNRQGNDRGTQYRSAIFYHSEAQKNTAQEVLREAEAQWRKPVVTQILPAGPWYPAEDYHQDYLQKHAHGYSCHYERDFGEGAQTRK